MTPAERAGALRNRLEELRNRGVGGNVTLDILIELTEIVAATCQTKAPSESTALNSGDAALKAGQG